MKEGQNISNIHAIEVYRKPLLLLFLQYCHLLIMYTGASLHKFLVAVTRVLYINVSYVVYPNIYLALSYSICEHYINKATGVHVLVDC